MIIYILICACFIPFVEKHFNENKEFPFWKGALLTFFIPPFVVVSMLIIAINFLADFIVDVYFFFRN